MTRVSWNPWHGCHKCSPGCLNCFVFYMDKKRSINTSVVTKSKTNFNLPLKKDRKGNYKIEPNSEVATCFTSDFFLEEADAWRDEAWKIIKERQDVYFVIPTKRINRFNKSIPEDWGSGYNNVAIAVSCENQEKANERLPIFINIKAKLKFIFVSPILEYVDLKEYLKTGKIDMVSIGGESYENARPCNFEWIKQIKKDCDLYDVKFDFHQTGSNFIKDGKHYKIDHFKEYSQAKKALEYLEKYNSEQRNIENNTRK